MSDLLDCITLSCLFSDVFPFLRKCMRKEPATPKDVYLKESSLSCSDAILQCGRHVVFSKQEIEDIFASVPAHFPPLEPWGWVTQWQSFRATKYQESKNNSSNGNNNKEDGPPELVHTGAGGKLEHHRWEQILELFTDGIIEQVVLHRLHEGKRGFSLFGMMVRMMRVEVFFAFLFAFFRMSAALFQVFFLSKILDIVSQSEDYPVGVELLFPVGLMCSCILQSLMQHNIFHTMWRCGARSRGFLCGLIYRKAFQQIPQFQHLASSGNQMNLAASDANAIVEWLSFSVFLVSAPIEATCATIWIGVELGYVALATAAVSVFLLIVQILVGRSVGKYRGTTFHFADGRLKALTEFLGGISIVKMCSWERSVDKLVTELRNSECAELRVGTVIKLLNLSFFFIVPGVLSVLTFSLLYTYRDSIDVRTTFVVIALLQVVSRAFALVPRSVSALATGWASLKRIEAFLALDFETPTLSSQLEGRKAAESKERYRKKRDFRQEKEQSEEESREGDEQPRRPYAVVLQGMFQWPHSDTTETTKKTRKQKIGENNTSAAATTTTTAKDTDNACIGENVDSTVDDFSIEVDMKTEEGSLTVVMGPVGCGKTTVLQALLQNCLSAKDQEKRKGRLPFTRLVEGKVAYVPQEAWIRDGTVRDNILFGRPFQQDLYEMVLWSCCLERDIHQWGGDLTEVGEKGITLSGGQRQRISLARACYSNADVYLLDDPISAVDAHVARFLMRNCLRGLLKHRTVVLVTHHPHPLRHADYLLRLDRNGQQVSFAPPSRLGEFEGEDQILPVAEPSDSSAAFSEQDNLAGGVKLESSTDLTSTSSPEKGQRRNEGKLSEDCVALLGQGRTLTQTETIFIEGVGFATYVAYARAGKCSVFFTAIFLFVFCQALRNLGEWWYTVWSSDAYHWDVWKYIVVEFAIVTLSTSLSLLRSGIHAQFTTNASVTLHHGILQGILYSPMYFFEATPLGRILNRFAKDMDYVDDILPKCTFDFIQFFLVCVGALVLMAVAVPYFLIAVVVCAILFGLVMRFYLPCARQLRRLEGMSRSPSQQKMQAYLSGLTTIRAFELSAPYYEEFLDSVDLTTGCIVHVDRCQRWAGIRMDWMASFGAFCISFLCVIFQDSVATAIAGLAISQSLMLTGLLQFSLRMGAESESIMTSAERLLEYADLPSEKNEGKRLPQRSDSDVAVETSPPSSPDDDRKAISEASSLPPLWPSTGKLEVRQLTVAYPSHPDFNVLSEVSFHARAGDKVAIVGRTGAGKSTILNCFFRLIGIPPKSIFLDDVDICEVDLYHLRSRIGVIPQSPKLFEGTLRRNLDPFDEYSEEELWSVLRRVQLHSLLKEDNADDDITMSYPTPTTSQPHTPLVGDVAGTNAKTSGSGTFVAGRSPTSRRPTGWNPLLVNVGEQGSSLSVGQKQLVCAARSLLRRSKIMLMDEATANVDMKTDAAIQKMIREECVGTTFITIAHRLHTVLDYDRVVVLERGKVVETGKPSELVADGEKEGKPNAFFQLYQSMQASSETEGHT